MRKVSQSPYLIEPPDELEVTSQPPLPTTMPSPFLVRGDGFVDSVSLARCTFTDSHLRKPRNASPYK